MVGALGSRELPLLPLLVENKFFWGKTPPDEHVPKIQCRKNVGNSLTYAFVQQEKPIPTKCVQVTRLPTSLQLFMIIFSYLFPFNGNLEIRPI